MSKPAVVTLPFVLLLLDYWPLGRMTEQRPVRRRERLVMRRYAAYTPCYAELLGCVLEKLPLLALAAASCAVTVWRRGAP